MSFDICQFAFQPPGSNLALLLRSCAALARHPRRPVGLHHARSARWLTMRERGPGACPAYRAARGGVPPRRPPALSRVLVPAFSCALRAHRLGGPPALCRRGLFGGHPCPPLLQTASNFAGAFSPTLNRPLKVSIGSRHLGTLGASSQAPCTCQEPPDILPRAMPKGIRHQGILCRLPEWLAFTPAKGGSRG
jgi:hypothetical protein